MGSSSVSTSLRSPRNAGGSSSRSSSTWPRTAGSLPGALWQLYARTGNTFYRDQATARTLPLAGQATTQIDDLTFRILNSFRPLYESSGSASDRQVLLNAAASKNTQWNETVGAFRTPWRKSDSGNPLANYGIVLDQSMDMELLFWAARETGNQAYYDRAVRVVTETRRASISGVQRHLRIGYNRAARLVEQMEQDGIVSAPQHNGNREVLAPPPPKD